MRIILIFTFLVNISNAEKLHFRQVFNNYSNLVSLNDKDINYYYFECEPHLRNTLKHLLNRDLDSAHKALKKDYIKSWRYKIDTALIAYEYFKDKEILNYEIKRLRGMPSSSEMLNMLARLLVYTGQKKEALVTLG